jgi:hypothetical protein
MSEIDAERNDNAEPTHSGMTHFLWQQLPYVVALVLAIAGVAYTNASHQPLVGYWEFLALAIGVVCVINKWPELALGCRPGHDEHHASIGRSATAPDPGNQPCPPHIACARHVPRRHQSSFATNRLPRSCDGCCGSRNILAAAIGHLLPAGRRLADRSWRHVLASPGPSASSDGCRHSVSREYSHAAAAASMEKVILWAQ